MNCRLGILIGLSVPDPHMLYADPDPVIFGNGDHCTDPDPSIKSKIC